MAALGEEQKGDGCRKSQRGGCGETAAAIDAGPAAGLCSRSVPHRRTASSGSIPPFFIWGIYPSAFPRCLPTLSASLLGLKLCKSSTFPLLSCCCSSLFFDWVCFNPRGKPAEAPAGFCFCSPFFARARQKHIKSRRKKFVSLCIWSVSQPTGGASL